MKLPYMNKNYKKQNFLSFCLACVIIFFDCLTIIFLFHTHGEMFSKIFFSDSLDTGMDFFHSIEYTRGRAPYDLFGTLYPPLANLFFRVLYQLVPFWQSSNWTNTFEGGISARGSSSDLRVWQPTMMLFILFIIISALIFVIMLQKFLHDIPYCNLVTTCLLFSYGVVYAFERGNIVIIAMLLSLFFVIYNNSQNKFLSELALLALAIAAGLKIYPAILGFLLLYDKQYAKAVRTILYGLSMFILPSFAFKEGISAIGKFLKILNNYIASDELVTNGFSFDKIINTCIIFIEHVTGIEYNSTFLIETLPAFNIVFILIPIICGFFVKKNWQRVLACSLALILCNGQGIYNLVFMLIPLVIMIKEENVVHRSIVIPFFALLNFHIITPDIAIASGALSCIYIRIQLGIVITFTYLLVTTLQNTTVAFKRPKTQKENNKSRATPYLK